MQKINLRDLYPDTYKTDVFVDVAEEVLAAIRGQEQDDAAYERRKYRHKAHYSLNREDGIENDKEKRQFPMYGGWRFLYASYRSYEPATIVPVHKQMGAGWRPGFFWQVNPCRIM